MDEFTALADPTRRKILEMLASHGELAASDIHKQFPVTPPAISQHLKVLKEARLVRVRKQAQQRIYALDREKIVALEAWLKQVRQLWDESFAALAEHLEAEKQKHSKKSKEQS